MVSDGKWRLGQEDKPCPAGAAKGERIFVPDVKKNDPFSFKGIPKILKDNNACLLPILAELFRIHKTGGYQVRVFKRRL
jgi:hypothetical protein